MTGATTAPRTGTATVTRGRVPGRTVLLVASAGAFLAFLDATVVNVAFTSIQASFPEAGIGTLSWVLNAYNIVFAAFLVVCGRLADLLGRRAAFVWGTAIFTLASVLCAAGRVGRGARRLPRAAGLRRRPARARPRWPSSSRRSRPRGAPTPSGCGARAPPWPPGSARRWAGCSSSWAAGAGRSSSTCRSGWLRCSPPAACSSRAAPRAGAGCPTCWGATAFAGALGLLTLGVVSVEEHGVASGWFWLPLLGSAVLLAAFVASSRRHPSPLLDATLLRVRAFAVGNVVTVVAGMGFYAYLLTNVLWLQYVWGWTVLQAGLALVPGALVAAVVAARLGPVAARYGYTRVIVPGALVWAGAYVWYALVTGPDPAFLTEWLPGQVLSGLGAGAVLPLTASAALSAVPGGRYATASAFVSSTRQTGAAVGIALLVVVVGTPTPATAEDVLRDGWWLSAACFVVCAVSRAVRRPGGDRGARRRDRGPGQRPAAAAGPAPARRARPDGPGRRPPVRPPAREQPAGADRERRDGGAAGGRGPLRPGRPGGLAVPRPRGPARGRHRRRGGARGRAGRRARRAGPARGRTSLGHRCAPAGTPSCCGSARPGSGAPWPPTPPPTPP